MQQAWGWSSEKAVRTFLDRLEADGRISRQAGKPTGQPSAVITICKYDDYQFGELVAGKPMGSSGADHPEKTDTPSDLPLDKPIGEPRSADKPSFEGEKLFHDVIDGEPKDHPIGEPTGEPTSKNGQQLEEVENKKRKNTRSRAGEPAGFAEWYSIYPKKKKPDAALRAYARVIASGRISEADLLVRTKLFAAEWAKRSVTDRKYIPYPATWLNDGEYADEPDGPAPKVPAPTQDPKTFTDERWKQMLTLHARGGQWSTHWGPPPDAPGCLVPAVLLLQARSRSPPPAGNNSEPDALH
ncbi:hypothetical protein [Rhodopseudomonas sp. RCAM05734]|uniref:hypothetical protein n=1 Tax=Rhodopseudomonas sp. RCAM05734 TaxID=3457549 RepID=UPI0040444536